MEFPTLGKNCEYENCNQLDFLPIECICKKIFCGEHYYMHQCEVAPSPRDINLLCDESVEEHKVHMCSLDFCCQRFYPENKCKICKKQFCMDHRFHAPCHKDEEDTIAAKRERRDEPLRQYKEINERTQDKITEKLRKSLAASPKKSTASKVHLMRVKQKALGPQSIPAADRLHFIIVKPKNTEAKPVKVIDNVDELVELQPSRLDPDLKDCMAAFISSRWSLGRAMDSICDTCNIVNNNNQIGETKLRLFRHMDGYCVCPVRMDIEIMELINKEVLLDGDKLVIEYLRSDILSNLKENSQVFLIR